MISLTSIVFICVASYIFWRYIVYPAFISPLSKIPNAHFTAPFSPLWILWKRCTYQENRTVQAAHEKYGKIVRIGPNDVSVNSVDDGIRVVYTGGFEKWNFYPNLFANFGFPCMFSTAENKPHAARKRIVTHMYSKSNVQSSPDVQKISRHMVFKRLLPCVREFADEGRDVEIEYFSYAVAMDFISAFTFGLGNGSDFIRNREEGREWFRIYQSRRPYEFWQGELPSFTSWTDRLGLPVIPRWVDKANRFLERWMVQRCTASKEWTSTLEEGKTEDKTPSLVYDQLLKGKKTKTADGDTREPPVLDLASELFDHVAAGHHTSGVALTYLFWELSRQPELQTALREELSSLDPSIHISDASETKSLPSPRALEGLPLLHALFMETLRIHPPIPGAQPRVTPATPVSVAGSPPLNPGTRISSQAYTLHRNPDVFPEPKAWKPSRWLEATEEKKAEMLKWFWAFGSGSRMCIGSHIAMQNMRLITAAIYSNFTTSIVDDSGIEQEDTWTAGPTGKVVLRFHRIETS